MEQRNQSKIAIFIALCFIISSMSTIVNADQEDTLTSTIHSNWLGDESHGYIIKFNRAPTAEELGNIMINSSHQISNQEMMIQTNFSWGNGLGIKEITEYLVTLPIRSPMEMKLILRCMLIRHLLHLDCLILLFGHNH